MKEVNWFEEGIIPGLLYFQNGGEYSGSVNDFGDKTAKEFRYKMEADPKEGVMKAMVWYGPLCYSKSEIADQADFTIDDGGRGKMIEWIKAKYETMIE